MPLIQAVDNLMSLNTHLLLLLMYLSIH